MSEPKFTPGKWIVDPTNYKEGKSVEALDGSIIATVVENTDFGCFPAMRYNAALIASAPDMYATLDSLKQYISESCGDACGSIIVIREIEALLEKARGES